jgi:hypothetical protein
MAALIHTKLPNEPICNLREVAAIEPLTNLPNYPVIQNEPILLTKKSNDLSVTRKISTRFVSLSAANREREASVSHCKSASTNLAQAPGFPTFPPPLRFVPILHRSNLFNPKKVNFVISNRSISRFIQHPSRQFIPGAPPTFSPKSGWSNRPSSTIVWAGFERANPLCKGK